MIDYLRYIYKAVGRYFGGTIVVAQEADDIISSPIVKEGIIDSSDCEILLDQREFVSRFDQIQSPLGPAGKEKP